MTTNTCYAIVAVALEKHIANDGYQFTPAEMEAIEAVMAEQTKSVTEQRPDETTE